MPETTKNQSIRDQVARQLLDPNGHPRDLSSLARLFELSPRTLRRRLTAEGTSYRAVRAEVLGASAITMLKSGEYTHDEIASKLGISDGANLRQAFRRWTKQSTKNFKPNKHA